METINHQPEHFSPLLDQLFVITRGLPELRPVNSDLFDHPKHFEASLSEHLELLDKTTTLCDEELAIIQRANSDFFGVGATPDFTLGTFGLKSTQTEPLSFSVLRVDEPTAVEALSELDKKLRLSHELKDSGRKIRQSDPEFDLLLTDHFDIYDANVLNSFMISRYFQEYFDASLANTEESKPVDKNALINLLAEVMLLDNASGKNEFRDIFDVWVTPKTRGGLGWIDPSKLESFKEALKNS